MKEILRLPAPYSLKQKIIMDAMMTPGLLELWVAAGSKSGKSISAACSMIARATIKKDQLLRWVAPIYPQAKIGYKYCDKMIPSSLKTLNKSDPSILINHTNSLMQFKSGKYPEDLEGEAVHGYCLDECAKMAAQVYDSAKTTTTITRGPIIAFSTPKGKNWFYEKCMIAKEEMIWARKNDVQPTRLFLTFATIENPTVLPQAVEDAKRQLPERLFRQYFYSEFVDDGTVFQAYRECIFPGQESIDIDSKMQIWTHPMAKEKSVVIGVDWAKHQDHTVFIALDHHAEPKQVLGFQRFQGLAYTDAVGELYRFHKKFKEVAIIFHDKTGVGDAIDDLLAQANLPFEGITFGSSNKSAMVNLLGVSFEQHRILIPNWPILLRELDFFEVEVSDTGNLRYNAALGQHDDTIMALCLALKAANEYGNSDFEIKFLEELPKQKDTFEGYYKDLQDDW